MRKISAYNSLCGGETGIEASPKDVRLSKAKMCSSACCAVWFCVMICISVSLITKIHLAMNLQYMQACFTFLCLLYAKSHPRDQKSFNLCKEFDLLLNLTKTQEMLFSSKQDKPDSPILY